MELMTNVNLVPPPALPASPGLAADPAGKLVEKILVRDLNFFYGGNKALKGINVPLYQNRVTAFIGPSGCGKSTLLRALNRIYDLYPNQHAVGRILFDGTEVLGDRKSLGRLRQRDGGGETLANGA